MRTRMHMAMSVFIHQMRLLPWTLPLHALMAWPTWVGPLLAP